MSCGVARRHGLDPALLWLRCRPAVVVPIFFFFFFLSFVFLVVVVVIVAIFWAAPAAYGGSQARG